MTLHQPPSVTQFTTDDDTLVQSSSQVIKTALQDGALMRYLAQSKEHSVVQKFVADYAESILRSVKTADLLFQTSDEGSAAWCYRMPEQLPIVEEEEAIEAHSQTNPAALIERLFNQGRRSFFQAHGPFIYVHFFGTIPAMQRKGLGGRVMTAITDMADAERKWTYLEATDKGYHLYIRHGFEVLYTSQVKPDAPKMLHMARPQQ